ncbi:MAG: hypothetical protein IJ815_08150, partial [Lachnospiraceae bacterium]|nr:hypothetical protein [Lachnospiraceae bacterium]
MPRVGKNIYKRKDGRWEGRYIKCRINGKAKYASVYGHTCEETKQKLIKAKRIQLKNSEKASAGTVSEVGEKWLTEVSSTLKVSSINKYEGILHNYIVPRFRNTELSAIKNEDLIEFSNMLLKEGGRKKQGLCPSTVNQIMSVMNSLRIYAGETEQKITA